MRLLSGFNEFDNGAATFINPNGGKTTGFDVFNRISINVGTD